MHMKSRPALAIPILTLCAAGTVATASGQGAADSVAYREHIEPFFAAHCVRCHGEKKAKAGVTLHDLGGPAKFEAEVERWDKVLEMLGSGEMPPKKARQPSQQARAAVLGWIRARFAAIDRTSAWDTKLLYPEYGNFIEHDPLFDASVVAPAFSPSRLWRRGPHLFDSQVVRGIGLGKGRRGRPNGHLNKVKQPFAIEDKAGIVDFAAIVYADSATLATLMRNAEVIADKHLEGAMHELHVRVHGETPIDELPKDKRGRPKRPRYVKTPPEFRAIALAAEPPSDAQVEAALGKMFELIVERRPSADEVAKFGGLMRKCIADGGNAEGLRMALIAIAISPPAVYRMELGQGKRDAHGRRLLSPANLARAIAYALTDEMPDPALTDAARTGRLATRADAAREVTRIWDDAAIAKPRILRFFREFFGYHHAPKVFKDDARFGKSYGRLKVAQRLVDDADVLVRHIVDRDTDVLAELLTTDEYFVAHSGDNTAEKQAVDDLARFYDYFKRLAWKGFPYATPKQHAQHARSISRMFAHPNGNVVKGWMKYLTKCDEFGVTPIPDHQGRDYIAAYNLDVKTFSFPAEQPFVLAKGKRAGILMHPAWLIAHSLNLDNDPIRRGKWIRERLLAGTVPEVPITVDARIPEAPEQSLRERFAVTRQRECWRCHQKMNPLGMPFEAFDDFGRHRVVELLHAKGKSKPVDSTGRLADTGDAAIEGDVADPIEMVHRLAKSARVRQSFVRHAFRYFLGRNELPSDAPTLLAADKAYVANGGSFRALAISLLTSDSFLYRKPFPDRR